MKQIWSVVQTAFTAVGGFLGWYLGGLDGFLYALIVFVVADYITGVLCAVYDKKLSSEVGFKGIAKKVLIFVLVGIGNIIDVSILKEGSAIRLPSSFSISRMKVFPSWKIRHTWGLPIPKALKNVLETLSKEDEKSES